MSTADDHDPGDLEPELLARLHQLLLDAAPRAATLAEWDEVLVEALGAPEPADAANFVPDQTIWTDPHGDATVGFDLGDDDVEPATSHHDPWSGDDDWTPGQLWHSQHEVDDGLGGFDGDPDEEGDQ